jgi:hypothetical protein
VTVAWTVAAVVVGGWLLVALFQLGDIATVFLDSRTARDRDIPGRIARERTNELFWVLPVAVLVALLIGVGLDQAGQFSQAILATPARSNHFDGVAIATLFLLGLAVLVIGIAILTLAAVVATDHVSYSALRRRMREFENERITPTQLDAFSARLARIDRRTRSRTRPTRLLLTAQNLVRLIPVLVGVAVVVVVAIAQAAHPNAQNASLVLASIAAPVLSALFAALGIGFGVSSDAAWRRVYARQRIDILKLIDGFERVARKRVPGLGDRVARALKILGRQQGQ